MMAGKQNVPKQVALARRLRAWELRTHDRMTLIEITAQLNKEFPKYPLKSDHEAVRKMLKACEEEYRDEHTSEMDSLKLELLALKDHIIREALRAWERSKAPEKAVEKRGEQIMKQTAKDSDGDPRYLSVVLSAIQDIEKSFGLDKSLSPLLTANLNIDFSKLTTRQILEIKNANSVEDILAIIADPGAS